VNALDRWGLRVLALVAAVVAVFLLWATVGYRGLAGGCG